ncbi:uncharacterized protein LOC122011825 [Zingiber officinale]|nr:uncharacterized protein LOC122011825 [Zingiber officinale]
MTSIFTFKHFCFFMALFFFTVCCKSDQTPVSLVAKAMTCFDNSVVYSSCQESYRLNAEGTINVPKEATDDYCGGPCLSETKFVLSCVDEILYTFKFYNGASVQDVKYTLDAGCGDTNKRGDFDVAEHLGDSGSHYSHGAADGYADYDDAIANKISAPINLLIIFSFVLLL